MSSEPDHRTQAEAEMEEKQLCLEPVHNFFVRIVCTL
jgi:hypothetical protein